MVAGASVVVVGGAGVIGGAGVGGGGSVAGGWVEAVVCGVVTHPPDGQGVQTPHVIGQSSMTSPSSCDGSQ